MDYPQRGLRYDEFRLGQVFTTASRTITESHVMQFAGLSGDYNPIHTDEEFAKTTPFKKRVAHGLLGVIMASGLVTQLGIYEGTMIALLSQTLKYKNPVFIGDTIILNITVKHKKETSNPEHGIVLFDAKLQNQRDEIVLEGDWTVLMLR